MRGLAGLGRSGEWCVGINQEKSEAGVIYSLSLDHPRFSVESQIEGLAEMRAVWMRCLKGSCEAGPDVISLFENPNFLIVFEEDRVTIRLYGSSADGKPSGQFLCEARFSAADSRELGQAIREALVDASR